VPAGSAGGGTAGGDAAAGAIRAPQLWQNLFVGGFVVPHEGHTAASRAPHSAQNFAPSGLSC